MVPMYKKGGKKPKSSWMKESSEIKFGNGGLYSAAEKADNVAKLKKMHGMEGTKKKTGGADKPPFKWKTREERQTKKLNKNTEKITELEKIKESMLMNEKAEQEIVPDIKGNSEMQLLEDQLNKLKKRNTKLNKTLDKSIQKNSESTIKIAKTGGKSMEPGGGGRFAAMVSNLKKKGKSEGSAKKIAAAIGRKKYGKSKFQEMAAKGKKGLGGMSDSTSSNDAGMGMMKNPDKPGTAVGRFIKSIFKPKSKSLKPGYTPQRSKTKSCKGGSCFEKANERSGMNWRK
jgi:hypothetical protein